MGRDVVIVRTVDIPPPPAICEQLRALANHMRTVAVELRVSGLPAACPRAAEMAGAALLAEAWADEIEAEARP